MRARMLAAASMLLAAPTPRAAPVTEITVHEGTSMSVAASPDGQMLAIDLQGSIYTLSANGGAAKRVTDVFNDARQPTWSADGRWIAYQGYRDGVFHIWSVAADGTSQKQMTWGAFDDREPAWSHDGTRIAFSSDRGDAGNYDIFILDIATGALTQVTKSPAEEYMPSWSADDKEIAFISSRAGDQSLHVVTLATAADRKASNGVRADAPSFGPAGTLVYHATQGQSSHYEIDGKSITGNENVFAFRASWLSPDELVYVSDGKIRARSLAKSNVRTIEFAATLQVSKADYTPRKRDFDSRAPRKVLGIMKPALSPDGKSVAFSALGDIYLMPIGGKPVNLTHSPFLDTEPTWSADGSQLAWATDRSNSRMEIWVRDMKTGAEKRIVELPNAAMEPALSPDGKRVAYNDVNAIWRHGNIEIMDIASAKVVTLEEGIFAPGVPTWSPDGKRLVVAALKPFSTRFREGTNQILSMNADSTANDKSLVGDKWFLPEANLSIDSRVGDGPVWSPDGTRMAFVSEGMLEVVPVSAMGEPVGPARRVSNDMAFYPSWSGDSKKILYQSMDKLRLVDLESGVTRDVPVDLTYTPSIPTEKYLVHAGHLVDGMSKTSRADVDVLVEGNRIKSVVAHAAANHTGVKVVDASGLTVMPGLIESHSHLQADLGSLDRRAYLSWGITTVRSPGGTPYEAVLDREMSDANAFPGPRVFSTGYLMEWNRAYYWMAVAVSSPAHLELELERAKILQHDMIKSYVRMPDLMQKRIVDFAHAIGVPVSSHEVYPSALDGIDAVEHTTGTSRRGYSTKMATLNRSYDDVTQIIAGAGMTITPTLGLSGAALRQMVADDSALKTDPRLTLYPEWLVQQIVGARAGGGGGRGGRGGGRGAAPDPNAAAIAAFMAQPMNGSYEMIMNLKKAGVRIIAGTDTPMAPNLHAELQSYVAAGMTPFEALQTATVNAAAALHLDAGSVSAGKLADMVFVDGNPLEKITATYKVKMVIANGRLYDLEMLVKGPH